jgi:hypothetical protein
LKPLLVTPALPVLPEGNPRLRSSILFRFPDKKVEAAKQDFVRPHIAHAPTAPLDTSKWDGVPHPSYNPNLFLSYFHVFDEPKTCLQGRRFSSDEIVKAEIRKWLGEQNDFFYSLGLEGFTVS